jgi:hypothetical protein
MRELDRDWEVNGTNRCEKINLRVKDIGDVKNTEER